MKTAYIALGVVLLCACGPAVEELSTARGIASSAEPTGMLPAGMTAGEALGKVDQFDPRNDHADYAFTAKPGDVSRWSGEFESTDTLLLGYTGGAWDQRAFFVDLVRAAAPYVNSVAVYVDTTDAAYDLYYGLQDAGQIPSNLSFIKVPLDSIWMRDYGPLFAQASGGTRIIDLRYYWGRFQDDVFPTRLADAWEVPVSRPPLEGEGGNLQADGQGNCLASDWLVEQNWHEWGYDAADVRKVLKDYLGCKTTTFVPALAGEGTGHVDMLATITGPKQVIVGDYRQQDDWENADRLDQAAATLSAAGYQVRRVPMPGNWDGAFRSYTNSLAVGNAVLVPVYGDDQRFENQALAAFQQAYPGRDIIPIESQSIIQWSGAVHCVTMTLSN